MMRSSALISHVQQLARDFHAQASRYPTKKQDAQKPVDHSAYIVRRCSSAIRLFVADEELGEGGLFILAQRCERGLRFLKLREAGSRN